MSRAVYQSLYNQKRFDTGLCRGCGKPNENGHFSCPDCRKRQSEREKTTKQSRIAAGLCPRCGETALPDSQLCRRCYFYKVATETLKDARKALPIAALFDEQHERCVYTDELLILGVNASIDHKTPQCRGGGHNIENLQWVTKRINSNKFNLTHDEFVAECSSIAAKFS